MFIHDALEPKSRKGSFYPIGFFVFKYVHIFFSKFIEFKEHFQIPQLGNKIYVISIQILDNFLIH
jgi:hypothetical protein